MENNSPSMNHEEGTTTIKYNRIRPGDPAGRIIRAVNVPAVAIGGINSQNLNDVLSAGAINFSVVRAVCGSTTPLDAIKQLMSVWEKHLLKRSLC